MPSAYKSMVNKEDTSDDDMSDDGAFLGVEDSSAESSSTVRAEEDDTSESDSDQELRPAKSTELPLELKNRILMLTSRGVSSRHRHLLNDLHALLPHTYKDTKLDTKSSNNYNAALNGLADLHSCNYISFLEARKHGQDLYMWLAKAPNGPTIKFGVNNVHTMAELGFGGNCLKGGRGLVVFDQSFEDGVSSGESRGGEYKSLIREMLRGMFCVPARGVRGMKPFIDRIIGVYGLDGKIWIRVYEIREGEKDKGENKDKNDAQKKMDNTSISLVEIGPRFVLTPVLILEGSFGGAVIYKNERYVSGNQIRSDKRRKADVYSRRRNEADQRGLKKKVLAAARQDRVDTTLANNALFA